MTRQRGMTLVELVITIVIIGIAAAALFSAMASITARSSEPLLRQQSLSLAEAYLEEVLLQAFLDPATGTACPSPPAQRGDYDNVCDYAGLTDAGARSASIVSGVIWREISSLATASALAPSSAPLTRAPRISRPV